MANEKQPEEKKVRRITLDPSKFKISDDGQVAVTDPTLLDALRKAGIDDDASEHGIGVTVGIEW